MTPTTTMKRTLRKKSATEEETMSPISTISTMKSSSPLAHVTGAFTDLVKEMRDTQSALEQLEKTITETRQSWEKEQMEHTEMVRRRNEEEAMTKKREQETYEYETAKKRRQEEDAFSEKKAVWERNLRERKEEIEQEKKELEELRKVTAGFEAEKTKAVKDTFAQQEKIFQSEWSTERKLTEQQHKSEKEILVLKIENLTVETTRQKKEIEELKRALEAATAQIKDIAVRVIEATGSINKTPPPQSAALER